MKCLDRGVLDFQLALVVRGVERRAGDAERPIWHEDHCEHEARDVLTFALKHHRVRLHQRVLHRLDHTEFRVVLVLEHPARDTHYLGELGVLGK